LLKTSGAWSNRWRATWRQVGAVHLNRRRAIEVNRPYLAEATAGPVSHVR